MNMIIKINEYNNNLTIFKQILYETLKEVIHINFDNDLEQLILVCRIKDNKIDIKFTCYYIHSHIPQYYYLSDVMNHFISQDNLRKSIEWLDQNKSFIFSVYGNEKIVFEKKDYE